MKSGRALNIPLNEVKQIKKIYKQNPEQAKMEYPNLFYYFDGLLNTVVSQGFHPAGILASPITLPDNYGCFYGKDNKYIINLDMEEVHDSGLVKYDILGLKNVGIIEDTYTMINKKYPKSYEIDWNDKKVWNDIKISPVGIFQYESNFAFDSLKKFNVKSIDDLTLVNACIRPSGTSYRDSVFSHQIHKNPSELIDKVLKSSYGYLVYQEETIAFLQQCCGLSGGEADNVRRAIGRKQKERLDEAMPKILEGYCNNSDKPRKEAEKEVKEFLKVIEDSASYQFGFNHATAYSMIGYLCAYLRYYYPLEFCTSYLNNPSDTDKDKDIQNGTELALLKRIKIESPKFRYSTKDYSCDKETNTIYKGTSSIKGLTKKTGDILYSLKDNTYSNFYGLLKDALDNGVGIADILILTKLNYFEEFGKMKKLLKFIDIYKELGKVKTIKKDKEYLVKQIVLKDFCKKETAKQFSGFDNNKCLNYLFDKIPNEDEDVLTKCSNELKYYGYIGSNFEEINSKIYAVLDVNLRGKNKMVEVQQLKTGNKETLKVKASEFNSQPFDKGDILNIKYISDENKWIYDREINKCVKSLTTFEKILKEYEIL